MVGTQRLCSGARRAAGQTGLRGLCRGADDKFIPDQAIKSFRDALDKAGVKYEFVSYPDTVHSFTVPDADKHHIAGMKYNKSADEDSWKRLVALFEEKLKS